ncbi:UNKNOWN [Stylonychia lemnae]|uniref:Macro domain-containing protein n=1 Tax=Stylonychia lemnae TaxID=5949 RepID=A0A078A911_STYLE|nr:UNKNOWN [Stylonychia lemnae]|eukprot:CDW78760.1 UNKNOWN [Stylonychia lemnae]
MKVNSQQEQIEKKQQAEEEKSGYSFMKSFFGGIIQHLPPNIIEKELYKPQVNQPASGNSKSISKSASKPSTAKIDKIQQEQEMLQCQIAGQNKVILGGWLEVSLSQGDITEEKVDAIVNASNEHLIHDAGVSKAILMKGGIRIQEESEQWLKKNQQAQIGTARVITTSGLMKNCKYIIHAVGPVWTNGLIEDEKLLYDCIRDVFLTAIKYNCKSVAVPAISTGFYGFPKNLCAAHFFRAAEDFCFENYNNDSCLKQIRFTVFDDETWEAFYNEFTWRYKGRVFCFPNTGTFNEGLLARNFKRIRGQASQNFSQGLQKQQMSNEENDQSYYEELDEEVKEQISIAQSNSSDQIDQQKVKNVILKEVQTQTLTFDQLAQEIRETIEVDGMNKQFRQIQLNKG